MSEDALVTRDTTTPATRDDQVRWHVVIPVKDTDLAKSRLDAPAPLRRSDLARAVAALAHEPSLRVSVSAGGRAAAARFTFGAMVDGMETFLEEAR